MFLIPIDILLYPWIGAKTKEHQERQDPATDGMDKLTHRQSLRRSNGTLTKDGDEGL